MAEPLKKPIAEAVNLKCEKNLAESDKSIVCVTLDQIKQLMKTFILIPLFEMKLFLTKDRKTIVKLLVLSQLLAYSICMFSSQAHRMTYLYMLLVFDDFTATNYAHLSLVTQSAKAIILIVIMPILSRKFKVHDALLLSVFSACEILGASIKPFATVTWQFYIAYGIGVCGYCKFGTIRSLLSKTVEPDEVGRMFSVLAFFSSIMPMIGNPAFRQLYRYTMSTLPSAFFIFFAALQVIALCSNLFVFFKRSEIKNGEVQYDKQGSDVTSPIKNVS